ncbi:uncharacterized protein N7487_003273 [Penicillium crustosum]|uniref:uncharacterized protein n=1 Tax=Penicillium crustosum TaxID=36656 RepID=UPI0023963819|nr:uncharacterized protein N7487_003273 [Penicillium crustosum]KAJ5419723.1 hypothetical protein N7487_003273 [Penicillium crustosum]
MAQTTYTTRVNHGLQVGNNQGSIEASFYAYTAEDIDRLCLRDLRCPNSLAVKNRLKKTKDKLLLQSFEWILQNPEYLSWRDGEDICLLWIKGGAGKGKTMMSIGLIEELSRIRHEPTVVAYSFCENANNALNTLESIIKGLILQLMNQQTDLKESLRSRWDTMHDRFNEDMTSWQNLWNVLMEMLDRCHCSKIFIIVDALDECQDKGMADFFKRLVRNGLDQPAKIKWLLTSRPLDSAERALLVGRDQVQVNLDLKSKFVFEAVEAYISYKVDELSHLHRYRKTLSTEVKAKLTTKAEGTFLWVSLVCKTLESVSQDKVLTTIRNLPPGLHPFYDRILNQLSKGEPDDVYKCMRLLKAMILAYRPLKMEEVPSVTGLTNEDDAIQMLVNRCASFVRMQEHKIEFVHQSARDYLAGENGQSLLDSYERFGHNEVVLCCLSYLSNRLKVNLLDLSRLDSTRESSKPQKDTQGSVRLSCLNYAATFWVQHLKSIKRTDKAQSVFIEKGVVGTFLNKRLLEWLECLSLLDRLPWAIGLLKTLQNVVEGDPSASALVQDATRFLLRNYYTIAHWPLQIYSSAVIFSPELSIVKRKNSDKTSGYLKRAPVEETWGSLVQTLAGHADTVQTVAFSPDGTQIASGSWDKTIKLWDTTTGDLLKTLEGHSDQVSTIAFSPEGTQIASGSDDKTIKLWDTTTGDLLKTLEGHSDWVRTIAFSPDRTQIASCSVDKTIKLWDTITGDLQMTIEGHLDRVNVVVFSPDGTQIASCSDDKTIKLWNTITGDLQKTLEGHSDSISSMAFSPDGTQIISGSVDKTIKLWDTIMGDLQMTLEGHLDRVNVVVFSPDGTQIASGSVDTTIKLWETVTGNLQKTLVGHSNLLTTMVFSPDGTQIASGSIDTTIKLWDTVTGNLRKTLEGHSDIIGTMTFSPDGTQIISGSSDCTIKLWDTITSDSQKKIEGHLGGVDIVVFSPDGTQIASACGDKTGAEDETIMLWDTMGGHIVSGSIDNTIKLWDTVTGDLQNTLNGHSKSVRTVAFSPDGTQIVSGSDDKTIKLWDTITGDLQNTLKGHSKSVRTVAFSPDGTQIASGSDDRTIKLWGTTTGDLQKTLKGHSKSVRTVAFSSDGTQIASGSDDRTIKLWDICKYLNASKFLPRYFNSGFKVQLREEIQTSEPVHDLKYSAGDWYLATNIGPIRSEGIARDRREGNPSSLLSLSIREQWICYERIPFFRLPSDFQPLSYDVRGDQVAIGFGNGQVLSFYVDRRILQTMQEFAEVTIKQTT